MNKNNNKPVIAQITKEHYQILEKINQSESLSDLTNSEITTFARVNADHASLGRDPFPESIVLELEKREIKPQNFMH